MSTTADARAAIVTGSSLLELRTPRRLPEPGPGEVLVEVDLCGVCGTDVHYFQGLLPGASPTIFGHEWVGRVREIGAGASVELGDRVSVGAAPPCGQCPPCSAGHDDQCTIVRDDIRGLRTDAPWGGFASHVLVRADRLVSLPPSVDDASAAMLEPASVALRAVRRAAISPGQRVVVLGAGPIGLFVAQHAQHLGAEVVLVEPRASRRRIAEGLGISRSQPPVEVGAVIADLTGGLGVDVVMECTGAPSVLSSADEHLRDGGTVAVVGVPGASVTFDVNGWIRREVTHRASVGYTRADVLGALDLMAAGHLRTTGMHTRTVSLGDLATTLGELGEGAGDDCKVLVSPSQDTP